MKWNPGDYVQVTASESDSKVLYNGVLREIVYYQHIKEVHFKVERFDTGDVVWCTVARLRKGPSLLEAIAHAATGVKPGHAEAAGGSP